ncbi:MAG: acylneuraminate cytidylyltransferase family protein [Muribaculaceae bacterium]|nr:acylneuraminate cytidylyltransferase family protein [Muribaculaceae bacterium]
MKKANYLITICARGGSKGIPGKNIKEIGGKPLLVYTAEAALEYVRKHPADIVLSTDSEDIRKVGAEAGVPTDYERPDFLADDVCGKPEAIKDVMLYAEKHYGKRYDYVIDLDVTSPIRTLEDIEKCVEMIAANDDALTIFSVSPCGRNPYFNQVEESEDGYCHVVIDGKFTTRQGSPKVYDINGSIYVYRREALDCENPRAVTPRSIIYVMDHICFDLDEPLDYEYLAYLVESGRLKQLLKK